MEELIELFNSCCKSTMGTSKDKLTNNAKKKKNKFIVQNTLRQLFRIRFMFKASAEVVFQNGNWTSFTRMQIFRWKVHSKPNYQGEHRAYIYRKNTKTESVVLLPLETTLTGGGGGIGEESWKSDKSVLHICLPNDKWAIFSRESWSVFYSLSNSTARGGPLIELRNIEYAFTLTRWKSLSADAEGDFRKTMLDLYKPSRCIEHCGVLKSLFCRQSS